MTENNKDTLQQIIDLYIEKEPLLENSADEILAIKENAIADFKKAQILVKEDLIKDESVDNEDLEEIYLEILEKVKIEIEKKAELQLQAILEKYSKK